MASHDEGCDELTLTTPTGAQRARPRATMRDVAALAGVSLKTVSRVINTEPGVSAELAARVGTAIERLEYRHNLQASSLRRVDGKSATIGVNLEGVANPLSSPLPPPIDTRPRKAGLVGAPRS